MKDCRSASLTALLAVQALLVQACASGCNSTTEIAAGEWCLLASSLSQPLRHFDASASCSSMAGYSSMLIHTAEEMEVFTTVFTVEVWTDYMYDSVLGEVYEYSTGITRSNWIFDPFFLNTTSDCSKEPRLWAQQQMISASLSILAAGWTSAPAGATRLAVASGCAPWRALLRPASHLWHRSPPVQEPVRHHPAPQQPAQ